MSDLLVVNCTSDETRVALVEGGMVVELYMERSRDRSVVGNIYKGKIVRVLPGMQASFVDVSHERAGFLHASDVYDFDPDIANVDVEGDEDEFPQIGRGRGKQRTAIEKSLKTGQEILVQVAKEPIGTKGARLTSHISLPGRYVVFMPTVSHVGISRRIESAKERKRLRDLVDAARPEGTGVIVRTVSTGVPDEEIQRDLETLIKLWGELLEKASRVRAPYLLYEEPDLLLRATRDLLTDDIAGIVVDSEQGRDRVQQFVDMFAPAHSGCVELYTHQDPIFDEYGIEPEITRALSRHVDLPSGGYLIIDRTEALTSVDVNTGSFVGKGKKLAETILQTNLEALEELVYQLRLRNIGGIIVIDFIDMETAKHRKTVYEALEAALKRDKVTTNALAISDFGLVEMTRKRVRESLVQFLCEPCPHCQANGYMKSNATVAYEILRELAREAPGTSSPDLYVQANPGVVDFLRQSEKNGIREFEKTWDKKIHLRTRRDMDEETFEIAVSV